MGDSIDRGWGVVVVVVTVLLLLGLVVQENSLDLVQEMGIQVKSLVGLMSYAGLVVTAASTGAKGTGATERRYSILDWGLSEDNCWEQESQSEHLETRNMIRLTLFGHFLPLSSSSSPISGLTAENLGNMFKDVRRGSMDLLMRKHPRTVTVTSAATPETI